MASLDVDELIANSKKAALDVANLMRVRIGKPPVDHLYPGVPGNAASCPITNTIYDDDIDRNDWNVITGGFGVTAVQMKGARSELIRFHDEWYDAQRFVRYFDAGEFPDLVKK
jgi:hypothetical protein